jgi:nucleoside-diphosphate-sugar epimerase
MKVAVTGASGFIGRHLLSHIVRRGGQVVATGRGKAPQWLPAEVEWFEADILRQGLDGAVLVEKFGCEALLHLAWITTPGLYWTSEDNALWERASCEMMRGFAQAGGRRIVGVGTCAEYEPPSEGPCDPAITPVAPRTPYSSSKDRVRRDMEALAAPFGLQAAWARVFFLYGPHEDPRRFAPTICRHLLRGEVAPSSHGQQVRDFLHISDCGDALAATALSNVTGAINICSGEPTKLAEISVLLGKLTRRSELLRIGAMPVRPDEPPNLWGSATRLRSEVGFKPRYDLESGLSDTVAYWRGIASDVRLERDSASGS